MWPWLHNCYNNGYCVFSLSSPTRDLIMNIISFCNTYFYCRIVLRIPSILKRKSNGAKSCSTLTPVSSTLTSCKSKKTPEFVWIGYHQQGNNPADNQHIRYGTRSSNKNLHLSVKQKTVKRKLIFNKTSPISALKVNCHLANLNRNINNIETVLTPTPTSTPTSRKGQKCTILSTPLPPIQARKPRVLFADNQPLNQNKYFMHSYGDLLAFNVSQPTLYWENDFINTNTLII